MKTETIEEFLKRGGKITKCEAQPVPEVIIPVKPIASSPHVMDLEEGAHYYAESISKLKKTRKKTKENTGINAALVPKGLLDSLDEI